MQLSIIIPVFNERATVLTVLDRVEAAAAGAEIIVVDDGSTDGSREILAERARKSGSHFALVEHARNRGKGAALVSGVTRAAGEYVLCQDADLEYDPADYEVLLTAVNNREAAAVYGSRFGAGRPKMSVRHVIGNRLLTGLTNLLYGSELTDMETCYKLVRRDLFLELDINCTRFDIEPELTAKLLKRGVAIREVPISYEGRGFADGKKISWVDFVSAVWTLVRLRFGA
jgi:glycosyltransferase involved in cell wall biosynthesis